MKPLLLCLLSLFGATPLATTANLNQSAPAKVILDTDIGDDIDDAWALAFILAHKNFDLLGVTISHGNTPARAPIAAKMLHIAGRDAIPVAVGRKTSDGYAHQYTWAEDFTAKRPIKQSAADFIVEQVKRYPGRVILLAVGPLQNVADALRKEPDLGKYVKRVVLMSGCVYGMANSKDKPVREWNVYQSTADAQLVYSAGLPLTIVPLDSTTYLRLSDEERKAAAGVGNGDRNRRSWRTSSPIRTASGLTEMLKIQAGLGFGEGQEVAITEDICCFRLPAGYRL